MVLVVNAKAELVIRTIKHTIRALQAWAEGVEKLGTKSSIRLAYFCTMCTCSFLELDCILTRQN